MTLDNVQFSCDTFCTYRHFLKREKHVNRATSNRLPFPNGLDVNFFTTFSLYMTKISSERKVLEDPYKRFEGDYF